MDHPERVRSLVSISAVLDPSGYVDKDESGETSEDETGDGDGGEEVTWPELRAAYDRLSPDGPAHGDVSIARPVPGAQLCIVPGAGHMVMEERPPATPRPYDSVCHRTG